MLNFTGRNSKLKIKICILIFCLSISLPGMALADREQENNPQITARAAILINAATGEILYEKNAYDRRYPASTTKIMTLITALEHGNLNDIVTTSKKAADTEGSSLDLITGEKMKLGDMLYGTMMVSGNDATVAVAEHISGSAEAFASIMTQKAHSIGAVNTNFVNPSGLPDVRHYSTARDLAHITAYGYKNPMFAHIVAAQYIVIPDRPSKNGKEENQEIKTENKILKFYEGGNGVKTGYTRAAGRCLVAGAKRFNTQLISVVLDSKDIWQDSINLLDYGFYEAKPINIIKQGDILKTIRVKGGDKKTLTLAASVDVNVSLSQNEYISAFVTRTDTPAEISAPVAAGQRVGVVRVLYGNKEIAVADLVATENIKRKSILDRLWSSVVSLFTGFADRSA
jgi:D-alanyl-D-alanine carboxypeptidase (penicillin-binding protein 5/6)